MGLTKQSRVIVFLLISLVVGIVGTLWYFSNSGYFISIPVTYNKYHHPFINVKFGDDIQKLHFKVGSKLPLYLEAEILERLDKQPNGTTQWRELNGQLYEAPAYRIPKIEIGDLVVADVIATLATREERNREMGRFLGGEFSLF